MDPRRRKTVLAEVTCRGGNGEFSKTDNVRPKVRISLERREREREEKGGREDPLLEFSQNFHVLYSFSFFLSFHIRDPFLAENRSLVNPEVIPVARTPRIIYRRAPYRPSTRAATLIFVRAAPPRWRAGVRCIDDDDGVVVGPARRWRTLCATDRWTDLVERVVPPHPVGSPSARLCPSKRLSAI